MAQAFDKTTHGVDGPQNVYVATNEPADPPYDGYWVPTNYVANAVNWGSVKTPVAPASFIKHFSIYIQASAGWSLGYLRESADGVLPYIPYSTDLDDIKVDNSTEINKLQDSYIDVPAGQTDIGFTNPNAVPPTEGYFIGNPVTHLFDLYRIVAITNGTKLYLIKVLLQDVLQNPDDEDLWKSSVIFEVKYFNGLTIPTSLKAIANDEKVFIDNIIKNAKAKRK